MRLHTTTTTTTIITTSFDLDRFVPRCESFFAARRRPVTCLQDPQAQPIITRLEEKASSSWSQICSKGGCSASYRVGSDAFPSRGTRAYPPLSPPPSFERCASRYRDAKPVIFEDSRIILLLSRNSSGGLKWRRD